MLVAKLVGCCSTCASEKDQKMTVDLSKRNTPSRLLRSPVDTDHIGEKSEYLDIVNTSKREKLDLDRLGQLSGATSPNTAKSGAGDPLFASIQRAK